MERHKRRPLRPERLHPESLRLYEYLRLHRPEWLTHAYNVLGYNHKQFDIEVELPHPAGTKRIGRLRSPAEPIVLWMNYGEELSIRFWTWHAHVEELEVGIASVDAILAEETVFVAPVCEGQLWSVMSGPAADLEALVLDTWRIYPEADEVLVRTWSGKLDRRIRRRGLRPKW